MDACNTSQCFNSQSMWVINVLGLLYLYGCLYNQALADVRLAGAGIEWLYCILCCLFMPLFRKIWNLISYFRMRNRTVILVLRLWVTYCYRKCHATLKWESSTPRLSSLGDVLGWPLRMDIKTKDWTWAVFTPHEPRPRKVHLWYSQENKGWAPLGLPC